MKKLIIGTLAIIMASAVPAAAQGWHGDSSRSYSREDRQQNRIYRNALRGELTPQELRKLARQQERIDRAQWRAGRDGYVSPSERRKLERMQDRASRNIQKKSNNRRDFW